MHLKTISEFIIVKIKENLLSVKTTSVYEEKSPKNPEITLIAVQ